MNPYEGKNHIYVYIICYIYIHVMNFNAISLLRKISGHEFKVQHKKEKTESFNCDYESRDPGDYI